MCSFLATLRYINALNNNNNNIHALYLVVQCTLYCVHRLKTTVNSVILFSHGVIFAALYFNAYSSERDKPALLQRTFTDCICISNTDVHLISDFLC